MNTVIQNTDPHAGFKQGSISYSYNCSLFFNFRLFTQQIPERLTEVMLNERLSANGTNGTFFKLDTNYTSVHLKKKEHTLGDAY